MIKQVRFSDSVKFFEKEFCDFWNVTPYKDPNAPCLFAGVYSRQDVFHINHHKGFKVVWNNGRVRNELFIHLIPKDLVVLKYTDAIDHTVIEDRYKIKRARFQLKDYSMFKPNKLGNKICCYLGSPKMRNLYGFPEVQRLKNITKHEIIISYLGKTREQMKSSIYDNCFVYFKPVLVGGAETANELALMGRKTVSPARGEYYLNYNTIQQAKELIDKEAQHIGEFRESVLPEDYFYTGAEWKEVEFWRV